MVGKTQKQEIANLRINAAIGSTAIVRMKVIRCWLLVAADIKE